MVGMPTFFEVAAQQESGAGPGQPQPLDRARSGHRGHLRGARRERQAPGHSSSNQPAAAALYTAIVTKVEARIARWSGFRLSMLGRAYVAKQVLASMVTYHATFVPMPRELLERLCRAIHTFVARTGQ